MIFTIAWRNIWRNPRRTILTILAISFACLVLEFFVGLQNSSYETSINASIKIFTGHIQIQPKGYFEKPEIQKTIGDPQNIIQKIKNIPQIDLIASRASSFALVSSADRTYGVQIFGVQPKNEAVISSISALVRQGRYLDSKDDNTAVIGWKLAKNLKVKVGSELTVLAQAADGSLAATVLNVVGVFESGAAEIDRAVIEVPLKYFQEVFNMDDTVHSLVIRIKNLDELDLVQRTLNQLLDRELTTLRWDQLLPGLKQAINLDMLSGRVFLMSLVIVVSFTILNTFLMSVLERKREFAIILALGQKPFSVTLVVLLEALMLTVLGIIFGIFCGSSLILYFGIFGFHVPGTEVVMKKWNLPAVVYTKLSLDAIVFGPLVVSISSLLSALYPAFRATKVELSRLLRTT